MLTDLVNLFISFFKVGLLSFGGAYSLIPIIEAEIVNNNQWMTQDEFLQVLGVVQVVPGAISIKFATYAGFKVAGVPGAIVANLGNLLFPALVMVVAYYAISFFQNNFYFDKIFYGIKYVVIGMIIMLMFQYMFKNELNTKAILFIVLGLVLTFFKIHPAFIVLLAGLLAFLL